MSDLGPDLSSLGISMDDIYNGRGPWCCETPPITASRSHAVLYELPATLQNPPKPHISSQVHHWDKEHVRMPYSPKYLHRVEENGQNRFKECWGIIEAALLQPIQSSRQLEAIIHSYNSRLPKFLELHNFFEILEEEEVALFFNDLLPKIINLALRLPEILPGSIPLLKREYNKSISLSQLQIASLLANAFLCTFPWIKENAETYPGINFIRLYGAHNRPGRENVVPEKLKCICHYFRRVTDVEPVGVVTFERKHISKSQLPDWHNINGNLGETRLHVSNTGVIEDDGLGLLQVDFANRNIGGGVIGQGCVQEEIRFIICPELIISRLFTEQLGPTEALIITGVERFSKYDGYGDTFTWDGNFNDTTPHDAWGRRRTTIVAIDAFRFPKPREQYTVPLMLRELNKAYAGFHSHLQQLPAVATGNWGCGAYGGNPRLKSLLQLMACSATHRDMVYYTFGNKDLQDDLYKMYSFLVSEQVTVSQLWKYLVKFSEANVKPIHLYSYIQQAHLDGRNKPRLKSFFGNINVIKQDKNRPSTSTDNSSHRKLKKHVPTKDTVDSPEITESSHAKDILDPSVLDSIVLESSQEVQIIESSQPEERCNKGIINSHKSICRSNVKEQNKILHLFDVIDEDATSQKEKRACKQNKPTISDGPSEVVEIMDTSQSEKPKAISTVDIPTTESSPQRKITDYFLKTN